MSRVIHIDSAGKDRNRLVKGIVITLRELAHQSQPDNTTRDQLAFISLALTAIFNTIEPSVAAWEKRGYWVKADRFRMEWGWSGSLADALRKALLEEDWGTIAKILGQISERFAHVKVSANHRMGKPWVGSWTKLTTG
jgi:hypothetical protein